jgi:hypothetical protein
MNNPIYKRDLIEAARRSRFPEEIVDRFAGAVEELPTDPIELMAEDTEQLAYIYEIRWRRLREQGLEIRGLEDAVEMLMTRDYFDPVYVLPLRARDLNLTAFIDTRVTLLLGLVAVPTWLSSPTPPPGVTST